MQMPLVGQYDGYGGGVNERTRTQPGQAEFFQLLVTQLKYQDPMSPMDDRDFIAQLAQFSMLEEMQALNQSQALALLGRDVFYRDPGSDEVDLGTVTSVISQGSSYTLMVDGDRKVDMDSVIEVLA